MTGLFDQPEVDFVLLADRAEAINGKLYLMGGAWDQIGVVDFSRPVTFSIALGLLIPWNATNVDHTLQLRLLDEDGATVLAIDGGFRAGRPPQLPQGAAQHNLATFTVAALLPHPGTYRVEASVNGHAGRGTSFFALPAAHPAHLPQWGQPAGGAP
jgi:hypothetical protein